MQNAIFSPKTFWIRLLWRILLFFKSSSKRFIYGEIMNIRHLSALMKINATFSFNIIGLTNPKC